MKLSKTQQDILRAVRAEGERTLPDAEARAIGGLTAKERLRHTAAMPSGSHIQSVIHMHSPSIPGMTIRTFHALVDAGLVEHIGDGYYRAVQPEDVPPCAASMGCLCAGHARGNEATDACDTSETP